MEFYVLIVSLDGNVVSVLIFKQIEIYFESKASELCFIINSVTVIVLGAKQKY